MSCPEHTFGHFKSALSILLATWLQQKEENNTEIYHLLVKMANWLTNEFTYQAVTEQHQCLFGAKIVSHS